MDENQSNLIGQVVLGNFEIQSVLGVGGFATAYRAVQQGSDREAVVKVAHSHLLSSDQGQMVRARFAAEFRALTRINHPNLVTLFTAGDTPDGIPALAMEFIRGEELKTILEKRAPLSEAELIPIFTQLSSAIQAIHEAGVIHRDVTPANIILTHRYDGSLLVKLLDFGIAQLHDATSRYTMGPIGTPRYLAPEQLDGEASPASDMFSLGSLLWWTCTGAEFLDDLESVREFFLAFNEFRSHNTPPDPLSRRPDLSPRLAEAIQLLMHPDPSRRPTSEQFALWWQQSLAAPVVPPPSTSATTASPKDPTQVLSRQDLEDHGIAQTERAPWSPSADPHARQETPRQARLLIISGNKTRRDWMERTLQLHHCQYIVAGSLENAQQHLRDDPPDLLLISPKPTQHSADTVLQYLRRSLKIDVASGPPILLVSQTPLAAHLRPSEPDDSISQEEGQGALIQLLARHCGRLALSLSPPSPEPLPRHNPALSRTQGQLQNRSFSSLHDPAPPRQSTPLPRQPVSQVRRPSSRNRMPSHEQPPPPISRARLPAVSRVPSPSSRAHSSSQARPSSQTHLPPAARSPEDNPQHQQAIQDFIGMMPEWLVQLSEAVENRDTAAAREICQFITKLASMLGATRIARQASVLGRMPATTPPEILLDAIEGLEMEYMNFFQTIGR